MIVLPVSVETATRGAQMGQAAAQAVVDGLYPGPNGNADKYFAAAVGYGGETGGTAIGRYLIGAAPHGGQVIVVEGLLGQGASEPMDRGLDAALAGHPSLRVVARGPGNLTAQGALAVVREAFAANPRASIVVDYGAVMGDAIAAFLQQTGRRNVLHVTAGATPTTPRWLGTPYLRATLYWSAAEVGRTAAQTLLQVVRDKDEQADPFLHTLEPERAHDAARRASQRHDGAGADPPARAADRGRAAARADAGLDLDRRRRGLTATSTSPPRGRAPRSPRPPARRPRRALRRRSRRPCAPSGACRPRGRCRR